LLGENELLVGARLSLSLPEGLEGRSEAAAKRMEAQAMVTRAAHRARELKTEEAELRHDLKLLHELLHDSDKNIEKATSFLRLTQVEYVRGVKNGPDLLGALQKYIEFRDRKIHLHREYYETLAELTALVAGSERKEAAR
jgi:outer membrane protein TolC